MQPQLKMPSMNISNRKVICVRARTWILKRLRTMHSHCLTSNRSLVTLRKNWRRRRRKHWRGRWRSSKCKYLTLQLAMKMHRLTQVKSWKVQTRIDSRLDVSNLRSQSFQQLRTTTLLKQFLMMWFEFWRSEELEIFTWWENWSSFRT